MQNDIPKGHCDNAQLAFMWMPQNLSNEKATNIYLNQYVTWWRHQATMSK